MLTQRLNLILENESRVNCYIIAKKIDIAL